MLLTIWLHTALQMKRYETENTEYRRENHGTDVRVESYLVTSGRAV